MYKIHRGVELEEFEKAAVVSGVEEYEAFNLDVNPMSLVRPDGHPGVYGSYQPFSNKNAKVVNDCLHWCLPNPIDSWNDLLMEMLING